jgi:hypothetical protein
MFGAVAQRIQQDVAGVAPSGSVTPTAMMAMFALTSVMLSRFTTSVFFTTLLASTWMFAPRPIPWFMGGTYFSISHKTSLHDD